MSALVSPQLMEETWHAAAVMPPNAALHRQELCGKEQPELTGFVIGFTSELPPDAVGLALYAYVVVMEAFRRTETRFRKIHPGKIERAWKDNFAFLNDLKHAGHTRLPFRLEADRSSEPAVLQYVIDALTEQDDEDPVDLAELDFWHILQVLKTVADCMHDARTT